MKTIIYSLAVFALFVSPATCSKGKFNSPNNTYNSTTTSKDGDEEPPMIIVIDPTKPIPKP